MNSVLVKVKARIKDVIDKKEMSIYRVAELSGVSDTCIRNWYNKKDYEPTLDSIIKVCQALHISLAETFMTEDEELYPLSADKIELLNSWILLSEEQQANLLIFLKSFTKHDK